MAYQLSIKLPYLNTPYPLYSLLGDVTLRNCSVTTPYDSANINQYGLVYPLGTFTRHIYHLHHLCTHRRYLHS
jgi:hypothetical protein